MNAPGLGTRCFGVNFKNPVLAASGTFGYGREFGEFYDVDRLGGFVTKAVTPDSRRGNPPPRIIETPSGMLNAIGLQNNGLDDFLAKTAPDLEKFEAVVLVNVAGRTVEDYVTVTAALDSIPCIDGIELNISCPNVKEGGISFGASPESAACVVGAARDATIKPLIAKLTPNVADIASMARACEEAGADAVSLINTITGMVVDVEKRRPMLANVTGGLSGPAVRPVAVRMVYETARAVTIPVIGMGGIFSARDALEFLIAGASLVQIGCGMFVNPMLPIEVIDGLADYMKQHGFTAVGDIVGSLVVE